MGGRPSVFDGRYAPAVEFGKLEPVEPRLMLVHWIDSMGAGGGWEDMADVLDLGQKSERFKCVTVGFLIGENDEGVMLAQNLSADHETVAGWHYVPRPMIVQMFSLHEEVA